MHERSYGIVVGLNSYKNDISPLRGAVNDALDFYDWLIDTTPRGGGLPAANVARFIEGVSPDTGYIAILEELDNKLGLEALNATEAGMRDRLYIYFAGHGITVNHPGAEQTELSVFLSTENRSNNPRYQIAARTIKVGVSQLRYYKEVLLIMDCCRDLDILTDLTHLWATHRRRFGDDFPLPKIFIMYATESGSVTREFESAGGAYRGYFTEALVRNLRAATDDNGRITFNSVSEALYNSATNSPQLIPPEKGADLVFSEAGDTITAKLEIDFSALAGKNGSLQLIDPDHGYAEILLATEQNPVIHEPALPGKYTAILSMNDGTAANPQWKRRSFLIEPGQHYRLQYTQGDDND